MPAKYNRNKTDQGADDTSSTSRRRVLAGLAAASVTSVKPSRGNAAAAWRRGLARYPGTATVRAHYV